ALLKEFNYNYIYRDKRVVRADKFFSLVINEIFDLLCDCYDGDNTYNRLKQASKNYPRLPSHFMEWLDTYRVMYDRPPVLKNPTIFNIGNEKDYCKAVLLYISGMTDNYAIETYNEIISF
ncbi:MAG: hypothetical protein IJP10_01885, partial [Clostridia bacterium]|nr:hypothetical protein [Clostridia bacterium]